MLGACALTGATTVYRMGGAHAIAALAYGTESIRRVDVIVGPGNLYVQEAKRQVSGHVGIDSFAGPSDLVAIADPGTAPEPLTLDLLAQAEHGPGTLVVAISTSTDLLDALQRELGQAPDTGAVARLVKVDDHEQALALAQAIAPEHLQLARRQSRGTCPAHHPRRLRVRRRGRRHRVRRLHRGLQPRASHQRRRALCLGARPGSFPAEVHRGPRFRRRRRWLARLAAPVARAEGFELHARSMEARIRDNGRG